MQVRRFDEESIPKPRELTIEERLSLESDIKDPIPQKAAFGLGLVAIVVCLLLWFFYWIFKGSLWNLSLNCSESWSQTGGYWTVHFWIFSGPLYFWWFSTVGILLLITPSKESAIRSLIVLFVSIFTHIHFRIWSGASRPYWEDLQIVIRSRCDCSFGLPSWQSHIGTLLWCFLVYELVYKARHFTNIAKFTWIGVASFIILNITLAEIFYGRSSVPQTFIGTFHGLAWFSVGLILDVVFQKFTKSLFDGNRTFQLILVGASFLMMLLNFILWYAAYEPKIESMDIKHQRCFNCFRRGNWGVRNHVARTLAFSNMFFGIALGLFVANPNYDGPNDFMLAHHLSLKGGMRIGLMLALHFPLIFIFFWDFRPNKTYCFNTLFWVLTGFLITFVDIILNNKLSWNFRGDLYPRGSAMSSGAEGQALLDSKMQYKDPKVHFNPYSQLYDPRALNATGPNQSILSNNSSGIGSPSKRRPAPEVYI